MHERILIVVFLLLAPLSGCSKKEVPAGVNNIINTAVTTNPYSDLVKKVGGEKISVLTLIPPGTDPHDFEPSFNQVKEIAGVDIYFRVGEIFTIENNWMGNIRSNNKNIKVVDCSAGINIIDGNPHMWLGLEEVKSIIRNISDALSEISPADKEYFKENAAAFISKVDSMDRKIGSVLSEVSNKKMLVYHPAWKYFLSRYNVEEISIEREGKEPKAGDLREVIDYAKANNIKAIFVEPQFDMTSASAVADEIGAEMVKINPLPEDYLANLEDILNKLKEYLK